MKLTSIALTLLLIVSPIYASEKPLTNQDVVALCSAGFPEGVVAAKIEQAAEVQFDLSVDGLMALKEASVPETVVEAMLHREMSDESKPEPTEADVQQNADEAPPAQMTVEELRWGGISPPIIELESGTTRTKLSAEAGYDDRVGPDLIPFASRSFINYPGLEAAVRTTERQPSFLMTLTDGKERVIYLVKLDRDRNEGENGARSLRMGGRVTVRGGPQAGSYTAPSKRWFFEIQVERLSGTEFRITPEAPLKPGEYGIQLAVGGPNGGTLYSFGID